MQQLANYIDGELITAASGNWLDDFEPATGRRYAALPDSDHADVEPASGPAKRAFPVWSATPAEERSRWLLKLAALLERDLEKLARAESIDSGKPLALARRVDIPRAISNLRLFAAAATQFASDSHAMESPAINCTLRWRRGQGDFLHRRHPDRRRHREPRGAEVQETFPGTRRKKRHAGVRRLRLRNHRC